MNSNLWGAFSHELNALAELDRYRSRWRAFGLSKEDVERHMTAAIEAAKHSTGTVFDEIKRQDWMISNSVNRIAWRHCPAGRLLDGLIANLLGWTNVGPDSLPDGTQDWRGIPPGGNGRKRFVLPNWSTNGHHALQLWMHLDGTLMPGLCREFDADGQVIYAATIIWPDEEGDIQSLKGRFASLNWREKTPALAICKNWLEVAERFGPVYLILGDD